MSDGGGGEAASVPRLAERRQPSAEEAAWFKRGEHADQVEIPGWWFVLYNRRYQEALDAQRYRSGCAYLLLALSTVISLHRAPAAEAVRVVGFFYKALIPLGAFPVIYWLWLVPELVLLAVVLAVRFPPIVSLDWRRAVQAAQVERILGEVLTFQSEREAEKFLRHPTFRKAVHAESNAALLLLLQAVGLHVSSYLYHSATREKWAAQGRLDNFVQLIESTRKDRKIHQINSPQQTSNEDEEDDSNDP